MGQDRQGREDLRTLARLRRYRKVIVFGGAFDPVHQGHLEIARAAQKRIGADLVAWSPSRQARLRSCFAQSYAHRRAAVVAAITGTHKHSVFALEKETASSADFVVQRLRARLPRRVRFTVLIGSDQLAQLHRWVRWRRLLSTVSFVIASRDGHKPERDSAFSFRAQASCAGQRFRYVPPRILWRVEREIFAPRGRVRHQRRAVATLLRQPKIGFSASAIRAQRATAPDAQSAQVGS